MPHSFKTVADFLDRFAGEVEGRAKIDPPEEIKRKIRAFARGELSEPERDEMVTFLKENPEWVSLLADEVKALRPEGSGDTQKE